MHSPIPLTTSGRSLFREVNERIRDVNEAFRLWPSISELVCECTRSDCMAGLSVPGEVYDAVRGGAGRFLVAAGHEDGDHVVGGTETYSVVASASATVAPAAAAAAG